MASDLPEWAREQAREVFVSTCAPLPTIEQTGQAVEAIARALVAAEARGIERAAGSNDTLIESLEEGLMTDADLSKSDRVAMRHQIMALTEASAAIRKLQENGNGDA